MNEYIERCGKKRLGEIWRGGEGEGEARVGEQRRGDEVNYSHIPVLKTSRGYGTL